MRPYIRLGHKGFQIADGGFHRFGGLKNKRQLHLPGTKEIAHHAHAIQEDRVNNFQRPARFHRFVQKRLDSLFIAVDNTLF